MYTDMTGEQTYTCIALPKDVLLSREDLFKYNHDIFIGTPSKFEKKVYYYSIHGIFSNLNGECLLIFSKFRLNVDKCENICLLSIEKIVIFQRFSINTIHMLSYNIMIIC